MDEIQKIGGINFFSIQLRKQKIGIELAIKINGK